MGSLFTDDELREMCAATVDAATAAVDSGNDDSAKQLIKRMSREFAGLHDIYLSWISDLMDYIYRHDGEHALFQSMKRAVENTSIEPLQFKTDFRHRVQWAAAGLRSHGFGPLEIEEDDEKVVLKMKTCGSGQRLLQSGAYDPPRNLARVRPHTMTYGLPDFPIYCVHEALFELVSFETNGYLDRYCLPSERMAEQSCRFVLVKDPEFVPDRIYQRIGKAKPATS